MGQAWGRHHATDATMLGVSRGGQEVGVHSRVNCDGDFNDVRGHRCLNSSFIKVLI